MILGAARAAGLRERPSGGNVMVRKAGGAELVILAMNDPVMAAAIHGARKTLRKFLILAKNPGPTMGGFSVKIAIPAANGAEFFWIHPFAHVDDRFIGQINNTLRSAAHLKMGDTVSFVKNEIVDWMYGCRQDEGQLFRACHPQVGASGGSRSVQAPVRSGLFMTSRQCKNPPASRD